MEIKIELESDTQRLELFGPADKHLRMLRQATGVRITARKGDVLITGKAPEVKRAAEVVDRMQKRLIKRDSLNEKDVDDHVHRPLPDRLPADFLDTTEHDMTAINDRYGQEIDDREVGAQKANDIKKHGE